MPGGSHTISNSSTLTGWLEATGLDDFLLNPCACIFGEEEPPPPMPGERRRGQGQTRGQQQMGKKVSYNFSYNKKSIQIRG